LALLPEDGAGPPKHAVESTGPIYIYFTCAKLCFANSNVFIITHLFNSKQIIPRDLYTAVLLHEQNILMGLKRYVLVTVNIANKLLWDVTSCSLV
jgi:hypothetical protein